MPSDPRGPDRRLRFPLRARARLPQAHAHATATALRSHRERGRPVRLPGVRRQCAGARKSPGAQRGAGLDRKTHQPDRSQRRAHIFSWARSTWICRCRAMPSAAHCGMQRLHSRLSRRAPSSGLIGSMPGDAFPISPSSCKASIPVEFRRAIGNRDLRLRRLPARLPVEQIRAPTSRGGLRPRHGLDRTRTRRAFCLEQAEFLENSRQRDTAHRLRAVVAQYRGRARQCAEPRPSCIEALREPARAYPRLWCASTSLGPRTARPLVPSLTRGALVSAAR